MSEVLASTTSGLETAEALRIVERSLSDIASNLEGSARDIEVLA